MKILNLIGRDSELFDDDLKQYNSQISEMVNKSNFLVIGGAGSIGQAVTKEIFKRNPQKLHVVDISENNLVELVRDLRSSIGYIDGDFRTYAIDCGTIIYDIFYNNEGPYDYILNLSALKHVRSEKDPYTLMRMIDVNIFNTEKTIQLGIKNNLKKYFAVSSDKAANPANLMGASKRIMEHFLLETSEKVDVSTARFANVAFSDGSLLYGFNNRIQKKQPIAAPLDITRYFITNNESGELCLLSCLLGENRDVFFPKLNEKLNLLTFADIAVRYLNEIGYEAVECETEDEARKQVAHLIKLKKWPCYFFTSNTTGEKAFEEFYMESENVCFNKYKNIGVIKNKLPQNQEKIQFFKSEIQNLKKMKSWEKENFIKIFKQVLPELNHIERKKSLEQNM